MIKIFDEYLEIRMFYLKKHKTENFLEEMFEKNYS